MKKLLICIMALVCVSAACIAGQNTDELKSLKMLVSDYSKTCGGVSPAISPTGEDLAYYSGGYSDSRVGDVYLLFPLGMTDENTTVDPKKLNYTPGPEPSYRDPGMAQTRDMDWSPDGNWMAFVGRDGRLYICHVFDPVNKRTDMEVRLVARNDDAFDSIKVPRWSPDGKMIAYARAVSENLKTQVCVADVASGKETALADDGLMAEFLWEQPWSADSKRIVYAGGKPQMSMGISMCSSPIKTKQRDAGEHSFIAIVPVSGGSRRFIKCEGSGMCPSWSPTGDRIAFSCSVANSYKIAEKRYIGHVTMAIAICDANGNRRPVTTTGNFLSRKESSDEEAVFTKAIARTFTRQYGPRLTPLQAKMLRAGKMTTTEMSNIASSICFKETGLEIKSFSTTGDKPNDRPQGSEYKTAEAKAFAFMREAFKELMAPLMAKLAKLDVWPTWSPDGRNIAFMRGFPGEDCNNALVVWNPATGKEQTLVDHSGVDCFSWTQGGKLIVTQIRRLVSRQEDGLETKSQPGYPEIWLLEPKL